MQGTESVKGRQRERWSDRSRETPKNTLKDRITDTERKQRKTKTDRVDRDTVH